MYSYVQYLYYIGNKDCCTFVLGGVALEDARVGQSLTQSGTVVVSSAVWNVCNREKFFANVISESRFVEVLPVSAFTYISPH